MVQQALKSIYLFRNKTAYSSALDSLAELSSLVEDSLEVLSSVLEESPSSVSSSVSETVPNLLLSSTMEERETLLIAAVLISTSLTEAACSIT